MSITLRNPVDGTTVDADPKDADRLARLAEMGYLVVGKPAQPPSPKKNTRK